jgi:MreB/Mrl family cell shape determining protein
MNYLKRKYNLLVGERTAEQIKMEIGSAYPLDKPLTMEIKGRNLIEGVPKTITVDDSEIREALSECISTIMNAVRVALERTPPELSADISDRGIVLTGGGALIKNLDKRIRVQCGAGHGQDALGLQAAAEDFDRVRAASFELRAASEQLQIPRFARDDSPVNGVH